jgi:polyribonucleotide 5'-hydroxyl-kinase
MHQPHQYPHQQQPHASHAPTTAASSKGSDPNHNLPKPPSGFRRFVLEAEQELRIEVKSSGGGAGGGTSGGAGGSGTRGGGGGAGSSTSDKICAMVQKGSCEIFGYELAVQRSYKFVTGGGGLNFPLYTFHGCVVDVGHGDNSDNADADGGAAQDNEDEVSSDHLLSSRGINAYVAERDDTVQAIAYVNTHAQLEALRDEALAAAASAASASAATAANPAIAAAASTSSSPPPIMGPRVLVLGGSESGTSSLVKTLVSYAVKVGRTPLWVDLDPADSGVGLPGTMGVAVVTRDSLTLSTLLHGGGGMPIGTASPLSLWHGSTVPQPDLMRAQVSALATKIQKRMEAPDNEWERSSGMLVNAPSWLALDENWDVLRMALRELQISVVLLTGHDKLYSKLKGLQMQQQQHEDATDSEGGGFFLDKSVVVVKVPRSGGIVNRHAQQMRQIRSRSIRRYFYGEDLVETGGGAGGGAALSSANKGGEHAAATSSGPQPSLTPFLAQIKFDQLRLYRCTSMSLASSLLPLGATQTTEVVQLQPVPINEQITHHLLAVCHPHSVAQYDASGSAKDLYNAGVAGFVVVERVLVETEMLHLLAPCAGALPSHTLLIGDITWLD